MGTHRILPGGRWLSDLTQSGEPRNAMVVTGVIVFLALLLRDLNAIAPVITMFFLLTYAMLNVVVLIEQGLGLVSFRPLLRVPKIVPWMGLIGSVYVMFIVNPTVSLISVIVVIGFYGLLARQKLDAPFEDVRSGLFVSFAEWAAKKVTELPSMQERAWKPNLLVPVEDPNVLRGTFTMIRDLAHPKGSVKLLGIPEGRRDDDIRDGTQDDTPPSTELHGRLATLARAFRERGVFASATIIDSGTYQDALITGMQVLRGAFFKPNILFLPIPEEVERVAVCRRVIREAHRMKLGVQVYAPHPVARLGRRQSINVWIRDRSPDWKLRWDIGNLDLSILSAYKIKQNWGARMRLITVVEDPSQEKNARDFMERLMDLARLPTTEVIVEVGPFDAFVRRAPESDLNIFGLSPDPDFDFIRRMVDETGSSCLFMLDSGEESALA